MRYLVNYPQMVEEVFNNSAVAALAVCQLSKIDGGPNNPELVQKQIDELAPAGVLSLNKKITVIAIDDDFGPYDEAEVVVQEKIVEDTPLKHVETTRVVERHEPTEKKIIKSKI